MNAIKKLIGTRNQRFLKRYRRQLALINEKEKEFWTLPDQGYVEKVKNLKESLKHGASLDEILVEAFALVKAVCRHLQGKRWTVCESEISWDMIPFDVQLMGAIALAEGKITEMATGEGKTLVATLPLFLHALTGKGAHLATANDYLALRDSQWMGGIFNYLGLSVGCLQSGMTPPQRKEAYQADITYGAGKEFGFDYLRDHSMTHTQGEIVQRGHFYAIVDEVDCILIDEARTPLIISGNPMQETGIYPRLKPVIEHIIEEQKKICRDLIKEIDGIPSESFTVAKEGVKLFIVSRGDPIDAKLLKFKQDFQVAKLIRDAEVFLMRDLRRKRIKETLNKNLFYVVDEREKNCYLTDKAIAYLSKEEQSLFVLPDVVQELEILEDEAEFSEDEKQKQREEILSRYESQRENVHALTNLLKAYVLYKKDVDYCIEKGQVVLVDTFTGRLLYGRRLMEGLHQAIEAREGLSISPETHLIATISTQNYFRLYEKLSGMTGTAVSSASEFKQIYKIDVISIPTNKTLHRSDEKDEFFKTEKEKFEAILDQIRSIHETGRPILVGTVSIEKSESLSKKLKKINIPHQVLNARYHEEEARIIARAGEKNEVTLATNMAGRGTDIKIGLGVLGGLHVIGTERHESRRIDNQLRGRAGRQGDPGSSKFFNSLEDEVLKKFGTGKLVKAMKFLTIPMLMNMSRPFLEKLVDFAQSTVELRNFSLRRTLLEFDNVVDFQRRIIYALRYDILTESDSSSVIIDFLRRVNSERDWQNLYAKAKKDLGQDFHVVERLAILGIIDKYWVQQLSDLDRLRDGIGFRSFAQVNLLTEFKRESYRSFSSMMEGMTHALEKALMPETNETEKKST